MEAGSERKPDVFISFRGVDSRHSFRSHLYAALRDKNIDAYVDDQLRVGDEISPALLRAIENSKISVIIFTENYASSKWCLDELVKIMKCKQEGQIVVPIFYNLEPSEVRHQRGSYEEAFAKHQHRYKDHLGQLQEWRKALSEAAGLSGWSSSAFRDESAFIDAIIKDLIEKLNQTGSSDEYKRGLVGIVEHIEKLKSLMSSNETLPLPNVKIIGLWGMGGIGKTTIAAALYRKLSSEYEGSCFVEKVREEWEKDGCNQVRKDFLSKLLKEKNVQHFADPMGNDFTLKRLQRKRVFIVLDDLNDPNQLDYIIGGKNNYGPGSRIVVTTRDRQVINKVDEVYNVQGMDNHKALELFSLFAFQQKNPPPVYDDLSQKVVRYAAHNPLALRVYGSLLYNKSIGEWEGLLEKIDKIPNMEIMKVLRLSYESLDNQEKSIFLDIACFFKGERKDRIVALLNDGALLTEVRLSNLQDKSLVAISSNDEILMEGLIHKMGEQIVHENCARDPGKCSRLWDPNDIYHILKYNLGSEEVEGMFLDMSKIEEVCLKPDFFSKMYNLRFLSFQASNDNRCNVLLSEDLHFLSENLRILHWERYPRKFLPSTYFPEKLIELNLSHSQLEKLWDGVVNLPNLRSINLSFCKYLAELPDLSRASKLEGIDIEDCTSLYLIPSSVFNIDSLTTINARGCHGVTFLEGQDHVNSLERINFSGCCSLGEFPVISEIATFIDLSGTAFKELPPTIGYCNKLIELHLRDCKSLEHIPADTFSQLECLEILDLSNCQKVGAEALFPAIEGFKSLKILKLDNCLSLSKISPNLSKLSSLNLLSLSGSSIDSLPPSVKYLPSLKDLALKNCEKLKHLPELPRSIQRLNVSGCKSLMIISNLDSNYQYIQFRSMSEEEILQQLKGGYPEELFFYDCIKLRPRTVNSLLEDAQCRIQRAAFISSKSYISQLDNILVRIFLPRSEVPDWFSLKEVGSSIHCQIPAQVSDLKLLRFAFCLVVDTSPSDDESKGKALILSVECKCSFPALKQGWIGSSSDFFLTQPSSREHLYIWYDDAFCQNIMHVIGDKSNLEITFQFDVKINGSNGVKKCGVLVLNKYLDDQSRHSRL